MPKMNNDIEKLNIYILKQNINKLMKENGTKQKDLADLLMLTQSDISKRLSDNTTACFTLEQTYKIAHYYNVTVDYLIDGNQKETKKMSLSPVDICKYLVALSENHVIELTEKVVGEVVYNYCTNHEGYDYYTHSKTESNYIMAYFPNFEYPKNAIGDEKDDFEARAFVDGNLNENNTKINRFLNLYVDALEKYKRGDYTEELYESLIKGLLHDVG